MTVIDSKRRDLYHALISAGFTGRDVTGGSFEFRHGRLLRVDVGRTGAATIHLAGFPVATFKATCPDEAVAAAAIALVPQDERLEAFDSLRRGEHITADRGGVEKDQEWRCGQNLINPCTEDTREKRGHPPHETNPLGCGWVELVTLCFQDDGRLPL